jgi:hypothetical protein
LEVSSLHRPRVYTWICRWCVWGSDWAQVEVLWDCRSSWARVGTIQDGKLLALNLIYLRLSWAIDTCQQWTETVQKTQENQDWSFKSWFRISCQDRFYFKLLLFCSLKFSHDLYLTRQKLKTRRQEYAYKLSINSYFHFSLLSPHGIYFVYFSLYLSI